MAEPDREAPRKFGPIVLTPTIHPSARKPGPAPPGPPAQGAPAAPPTRFTGAQLIVAELVRRGIGCVAGIPGGAILPLYDALLGSPLQHVLVRHEQSAGFVAQGIARVTGRVGVCLATSGPGATNLVTALADAMADSVPVLAITANVPRSMLGSDAFQEVDTCALMRPVTKASFFVERAAELPSLLDEALTLAESGRRGPVVIDVPKDVLCEPLPLESLRRSAMALDSPAGESAAPRSAPASPAPRRRAPAGARRIADPQPSTWQAIARLLASSKRPLLYAGGGVRWAGAAGLVQQLAERVDAGVVASLHGLGSLAGSDPKMLGMLGMHGSAQANWATEEADLVLALGARFDDRATGKPEAFCPRATLVHIDIDPRELGKNRFIELGVACDLATALRELVGLVAPQARPLWHARLRALRERCARAPSQSAHFLDHLDGALPRDAIVTTDVGQHQMWVAQRIEFCRRRRLLTSGGLGTMGFGLPAAIGAALAAPGRKVVCVSGDGSLLMNLQELATLRELGLDVAIVVMNNAQLGMVRQQQELQYDRRFSAAHFERPTDFAAVASAFGVASRSARPEELDRAGLQHWLAAPGPALLDLQLVGADNVYPMVPPGAANRQMLLRDSAQL